VIAITFALPAESNELRGRLSHGGSVFPGHLPTVLGNVEIHEVMLCHTGVGASSVRKYLPKALAFRRPRLVIASGFAGGLDPALKTGDILAAENYSGKELVEVAMQFGAFRGRLVTRDATIEMAAEKAKLRRETGASAVDMETEEIAAVCAETGAPLLAARVILDTASTDLPVPFGVWFDVDRQRPRTARLVWHLFHHREAIGPFAEFVGNVGKARKVLTRFLVRLVKEV
jgi:nucleoside phosphorylase